VNTLELLVTNWKEKSYREAYPLDEASVAELQKQEPLIVRHGAALVGNCVGYLDGQIMRFCIYRVGPILFGKLATIPEFNEQFPQGT
jgi:hypothetical protein